MIEKEFDLVLALISRNGGTSYLVSKLLVNEEGSSTAFNKLHNVIVAEHISADPGDKTYMVLLDEDIVVYLRSADYDIVLKSS